MKSILFLVCSCAIILYLPSSAYCWSSEDLELFDLVESTDEIFYNVLGVDSKASSIDIRKAYRRLSIQYHPDKNSDPGAEERFRKIAAIADVLRNDERRKKYDLILQTGLPDWRMPIYYYRRVRNMGIFELFIFLLVLLTFGQFLLAWVAYWEKKYEIEEVILSKLKKKSKHQKKKLTNGKAAQAEEEFEATFISSIIQKPRYQDLFPVRFSLFVVHVLKSMPCYLVSCKEYFSTKTSGIPDEEEEESDDEPREARIRTKKNLKPIIPDYSGFSGSNGLEFEEKAKGNGISGVKNGIEQFFKENVASRFPTDADFQELKKLMKKFPNGTLQRWEKIADILKFSPSEVISMAKQMKSMNFSGSVPIAMQGLTGMEKRRMDLIPEPELELGNGHCNNNDLFDDASVKIEQNNINHHEGTVTNGSLSSTDDEQKSSRSEKAIWRQEQQRALETALHKFPKVTRARWDRIAECVPGKTKEDCIIRYKELALQLRMKKDKVV